MDIEDIKADIELRAVYCTIHNDCFCAEMADKYKNGTFTNKFANKLEMLAIAFFKKYGKTIGDDISRVVNRRVAIGKFTADDASNMSVIIQSFSNMKPIADAQIELDAVADYINAETIRMASDEAKDLVNDGKLEQASELLSNLELVDCVKTDCRDVYERSDDEIRKSFEVKDEQIVSLDGALGTVMNDSLVRKRLVALLGRPKAFKSWFLLYIARIARNQGKRVIFISTGDMTEEQVLNRIYMGDAETTDNERYANVQYVPCFDCVKNQSGTCFTKGHECKVSLLDEFGSLPDRPIMKDGYATCVNRKCENYKRAITYKHIHHPVLSPDTVIGLKNNKKDAGELVVQYAPTHTLTESGRRALIRTVCRQRGWLDDGKPQFDVVVVDYATLMAFERSDVRQSVNYIWQSLKQDTDIFNCLIVTAFHSNTSSFDFNDLTIRSFSECGAIWNEVTDAFAINQTPDERKHSEARIAALLKRYNEYDETKHAHCYGCLALGTPHIISRMETREMPKPSSNFYKN